MRYFLQKHALLLAAFLLLAGALFLFISRPKPPQTLTSGLFQPEKEKHENLLAQVKVFGFTGEPQTKDDSLAVALDFYGQANYPAAKKSFETYLAAYPDDHFARFYFGLTHLYLKDSETAFNILSPLSELQNFDLQDDARWYAALAAANVDKMRAMGLFARLDKDSTSKYQQAAAAVMSSILKNPTEFSFQIEGSEALTCTLVVAARAAWWQAGWMRALLAALFPAGGLSMIFWRRRINRLVKENANLGAEKDRSEALLLNILPAETAEELKKYGHSEARRFEQVTVLFCDFKDFTHISEQLPPEDLVASLGECFEAYDRIVGRFQLEKIKTVGDCYICAAGLAVGKWQLAVGSERQAEEDALQTVGAAQEMLRFLEDFNERQAAAGKPLFEARIGIHTGAVVAGIVGIKKYAYDIWGDTVNIAARMEQASEGGRINISGATYDLVKSRLACLHRGKIEAKGKGAVDMYFVE